MVSHVWNFKEKLNIKQEHNWLILEIVTQQTNKQQQQRRIREMMIVVRPKYNNCYMIIDALKKIF